MKLSRVETYGSFQNRPTLHGVTANVILYRNNYTNENFVICLFLMQFDEINFNHTIRHFQSHWFLLSNFKKTHF